jgi:hypothetical protein
VNAVPLSFLRGVVDDVPRYRARDLDEFARAAGVS